MKLILFLSFNFALLYICKVSSKHLNEHDVVGVDTNNKFNDLLNKAISGFRNVMRSGNESLGIPILDPYKIDNLFWTYEKEDMGIEVDVSTTSAGTLKGLANFEFVELAFDLNELYFRFRFGFDDLELEVPYKIDGVIGNLIPIIGEGVATAKIPFAYSDGYVYFSLKKNRIVVDEARVEYAKVSIPKFEIHGLMDLPSEFFDDIIDKLCYKYTTWRYTTNKADAFFKDFANKYLAGRTMDEAMEFLNYLAKMVE